MKFQCGAIHSVDCSCLVDLEFPGYIVTGWWKWILEVVWPCDMGLMSHNLINLGCYRLSSLF